MGAAIRSHDWEVSGLGPIQGWPPALRFSVDLMLSSPQAMFLLWGARMTFLHNDAYRPILGPRVANALGQPFRTLWADAWEQVRPLVEQAWEGRATRVEDMPLILARYGNEEQTWWTFSYTPVRDCSGEVAGVLCIPTETTDSIRSSAALRAEETRQRQILDSAWDHAIMATDGDGLVTRWNAGAEMVLGWSEAEMLGLSCSRIFTPEDVAAGRVEAEIATALSRGRASDERWHLRKDGSPFWASGEMTLLRDEDGKAIGFVKVLRDRTEDALARMRLAESETRLGAALHSAGLGTFEWDMDAGTINLDETSRAIFGFAPDEGHSMADILSRVMDVDLPGVEGTFRSGLQGSGRLEFDYRIVRSDGSVRALTSTCSRAGSGSAERRRMVGVFGDVTERRLVERTASDLNATLELMVARRTAERDRIWQVSRDMLGVADDLGVWVSVNPAWERILGWDPSQIEGRTSEWLEHPDDRERTRAEVVHIVENGHTLAFENRFRTKEGGYRILSWTAVRSGNLMYCVARDVTEERERETALRDSMDFARLALSAVGGVGVWTYDIPADLFRIDAAIAHLYGIDPARGASGVSSREFLSNLHPDDTDRLSATMAGGLARPGDIELEYRIRHPDGSVRHVLSRGYTYFDAVGNPVRRTGVGIDTTRQHMLEDQLRHAQKIEAVGQLTGGVAHDFNNLLTVIKSSTDLLKRPNLSEERRTRYVGAISDTVERAARLTGQLLAFARRQALKPEVFDVGRSVRSLVDMVGTLTGSRIRVSVEAPEIPCLIDADPSQFDTALVNIVVNARDAMEGEGRLSIVVRAVDGVPAGLAHPATEGSFVAVSVTDTGSGISPGDMERIFEPFFTTKQVGQGTGLGLSQVFGFAKQSGGEVRVESEVGHGSRFTLYLPRASGAATEKERPQASDPLTDGHGTRVLVVEDNGDVGAFAFQTLTELGYAVHWVPNAAEALSALATGGAFDIVFSDVMMPGMNGVDLAREIVRRLPRMPVVLTSGYSSVLAEEGTHGFELLQKPYSVDQLSQVLAKAVTASRAKRAVA